MTRVWHPGIDAEGGESFAEVDDSAVAQLRQSGWLLASERDEHLERVAAHPSQNRPDEDAEPAADEGAKTAPRRKGSGTTAGSTPGSEGS